MLVLKVAVVCVFVFVFVFVFIFVFVFVFVLIFVFVFVFADIVELLCAEGCSFSRWQPQSPNQWWIGGA